MHDFDLNLYNGPTLYVNMPIENTNVCSISHHLQYIHKSNKMKKFDLENEGQCQGGEKRDLRYSTGNIPFYITVSFPEF